MAEASSSTSSGSGDTTNDFVCHKHPLFPDLTEVQQSLVVAAMFAYIAVLTVVFLRLYHVAETSDKVPAFVKKWWPYLPQTWPLMGAILYVPVGCTHFISPYYENNICIMPPYGTWGWYKVPGSADFHVKWTGCTEIVCGAALAASGMLDRRASTFPWAKPVRKVVAPILFVLTGSVTFAHGYILTHGAWGFDDKPMPLGFHAFRNLIQALWLSNLLYMSVRDNLGYANGVDPKSKKKSS